VPLEVVRTTRPHEGEVIARQAVRDGRRRLIASGGDGSVNDVLNGLMDAGVDSREVTLAVAPTGTGNDWARSLGISRDPGRIAEAILAGRTMLHDVGVLESAGSPGEAAERTQSPQTPARPRWFINVGGAGLDAYVTARVPRPVPSALTYLRIALRSLIDYRSPVFTVDVDGTQFEDRMLLVFAANARFCGNRMHVAPGAVMDDGLLDVVLVRELGLLSALPKLVRLYRGRLPGDPAVRYLRGARVRVESVPPAEVQVDGQMAGQTPAVFSLLRRALRVVVGPAAHHAGAPDTRRDPPP
jgi:diacylglycerol kinase (ATP)